MVFGDALQEQTRLEALHRLEVLDTPPEETFDRLTRITKSALDMPIVLISLVDKDRQWFKSRQGLDVQETSREVSFCAHAIVHDEPLIVRDALKDDRFALNPLVTGEPNIRYYAGIPLETPDGHNIGTLCAIDRKPRDLAPDQIEMLQDLARLVIDAFMLRQIAETDSLTGAQTRLGFERDVNREIERSRRYGGSASVIAIDLDHFKSINDTFGHQAGDRVLQAVVRICKQNIRCVDLVCRLGGEEFVIYLPETDILGAKHVAKKLRKIMEETPISFNGNEIRFTASFGVARYSDRTHTFNDLLHQADYALYEAKTSGRNKVICYSDRLKLGRIA